MKFFAFPVLLVGLFLSGCGNREPAWAFGVPSDPRHRVTPKMQEVADRQPETSAPDFQLKDPDGIAYSLKDALKKGPAVLVAIKDGCPCSIEAQPLFNDLAKKYVGKATFIGLFNENAKKADKWIRQFEAVFPVLVDDQLVAIKQLKSERSVYTTLVNQDGKIVKLYPGYSRDMIIELDKKLSELTGIKGKPIDPAYAPLKMASGCQL